MNGRWKKKVKRLWRLLVRIWNNSNKFIMSIIIILELPGDAVTVCKVPSVRMVKTVNMAVILRQKEAGAKCDGLAPDRRLGKKTKYMVALLLSSASVNDRCIEPGVHRSHGDFFGNRSNHSFEE